MGQQKETGLQAEHVEIDRAGWKSPEPNFHYLTCATEKEKKEKKIEKKKVYE